MTFDLIIRKGRVVDGTGAPERCTDIGVVGDRIMALEDLSKAEARRVYDASGAVVAPGFIDVHAHSDAYLLLEPDAPSKLTQGITTEINGQCGGSAAPLYGAARMPSDWAGQHYGRLTPGGVVTPNAQPGPTWSTLADYRQLFEAIRPALNTIQFVGHNTLRAGVMGYAPRVATAPEVRQMTQRLEQALDEGGWGLSTGLLYQPGKYAETEEVLALVGAAAAREAFFATHMRSEGERLLESIDEVLQLTRATGIRTQISHLKTAGKDNWHKLEQVLARLVNARAEGLRLHADRYPYTAACTDLDVVLPEWASAGGREAILRNLREPATRCRVEEALDASARDWATIMIGGGWSDASRAFSGSTVAEAAQALSLTPGQVVCRFIDLDDTRTSAFFFGMCDENLKRILQAPWVMPGSDASLRAPWGPLGLDHPHPRAYGTMPRYLRLMTGRLAGVEGCFSLEEAVRRMTSLPAEAFGICRRGVLAPGAFADIVVFAEEAFCDVATYARPHQFAEGMRLVVVNGAPAYEHGRFSGQRRGRFLTRADF